MTDQAIEFLQEWVHEHVDPACLKKQVPLPQRVHELKEVCQRDAAAVGVTPEDIAEEVGDLDELLKTKLEDASEAGINKASESR